MTTINLMETLNPSSRPRQHPIAALRRFSRPRQIEEQCELCAAPLAADHQHLFDPKTRQLTCACDACAVLFSAREAGRLRRVPRRIEYLRDFRMTDPQWQALGVPIGLAFFSHNTPGQRVIALYPSPGGATEASPPMHAWQELVDDNPELASLEPDVEALLVNRVGDRKDCFRAPIDECYKLVGLIRTHWRGLSGGREVWQRIQRFFDDLQNRSRVPSHARENA